MDTQDFSDMARKAISRVSSQMADDADYLAIEIEVRGVNISGPDALRMFASGVRAAAEKMQTGND